MGAAVQVFFRNSALPTVDAWNAAIKAEGFDLVLDTFDLREDSGYLPALLKGEETGFEWYLSPVSDAEELESEQQRPDLGDCDTKAALCFTSYADEDVAASIAGAVLVKMIGGFYWDPETDDRFFHGREAIPVARKAVHEWEHRGPFKRDLVPATASPPPIPVQPPPIPGTSVPPLLETKPPSLRPYRLWCALFVLIYLGMLIYAILVSRGIAEPTLGLITEIVTTDDPVARAQANAEARENAFGGGVVAALGAIFYAFAAFVPRKPWGWSIGLVAIIASVFPFILTAAGMIPLLIRWITPETKRYFLKS
jgi:hypothetical protein